jgi:excisionase family DNA binding protein
LPREIGGSDRRRRSVKADHGLQPLRPVERLALRPKEAAEALGVSLGTLRKWMRDDSLPFMRLDGVVLIPRSELGEWMAERIEDERRTDAHTAEILDGL